MGTAKSLAMEYAPNAAGIIKIDVINMAKMTVQKIEKHLNKHIQEAQKRLEFELGFIHPDRSAIGHSSDVFNRAMNAITYNRCVELEMRIGIYYELLDYIRTGKTSEQIEWILTSSINKWETEKEREEAKRIKQMFGVTTNEPKFHEEQTVEKTDKQKTLM